MLRRLPGKQLRIQDPGFKFGNRALAFNNRDQQFGGCLSHIKGRLANCRKRRTEQFGNIGIGKTDYGDIVGNFLARGFQGRKAGGGNAVAGS